MVHITLTGAGGNGARFGYDGFLGLTPVVVKGVVATHIDSDGKPLPARALTAHVRCYEVRHSRFGQTHTHVMADHVQTLWSSPHDTASPLGEFEAPFRIVVPVDSAGASTAAFPDYRVFWRVEAAIAHPPIAGVGTRTSKQVDIPITRYAAPTPPPFAPGPSHHFLSSNKPRAPLLHYRVRVPPEAVGPQDILSVTLDVRPADPAVVVRSASLTVERRIELRDPPSTSSNASIDSFASSSSSSTSGRPLLPPTPASPALFSSGSTPPSAYADTIKTATTIVAGAESGAGRFARDENGLYTRTLALQWPASRTTSRWALGETLDTPLARISFSVKARVVVSGPNGTDSVELRDEPLVVVATNAAQRRLALARWREVQARDEALGIGTPAPPYAKRDGGRGTGSGRDPPGLERPSTGARRKERDDRPSRRNSARPHTSSGAAGGGSSRPKTRDGRSQTLSEGTLRPLTARPAALAATPATALGSMIIPPRSAPPQIQGIAAPTAVVRLNTITGETTVGAVLPPQMELVRAWEEELARIERRARRRSDAQNTRRGGDTQRRSVRVG
ncbi:hypothetical protein PENSPDRAFT_665619 [Peniophora sp. CONT]|nr:hypothetical protein PENSPDRAFT_665619 [Peniophora sp. CONT]